MAQLTFEIPDNQAQRVLDAFAGQHNYDPASGLTKTQFARQVIIRWIRNEVATWEAQQAANLPDVT